MVMSTKSPTARSFLVYEKFSIGFILVTVVVPLTLALLLDLPICILPKVG